MSNIHTYPSTPTKSCLDIEFKVECTVRVRVGVFVLITRYIIKCVLWPTMYRCGDAIDDLFRVFYPAAAPASRHFRPCHDIQNREGPLIVHHDLRDKSRLQLWLPRNAAAKREPIVISEVVGID